MPVPLNASMPEGLDLGPGWTLRVTALSTVDGSVVSAVNVDNLQIEAGAGSANLDNSGFDGQNPILIGINV